MVIDSREIDLTITDGEMCLIIKAITSFILIMKAQGISKDELAELEEYETVLDKFRCILKTFDFD